MRADGQYVVGASRRRYVEFCARSFRRPDLRPIWLPDPGCPRQRHHHANPNQDLPPWATDTFVYTIRDADGDESTTTISVKVLDSKLAGTDSEVTVYEKALDLTKDGNDLAGGNVVGSDRSSAETASGSLTDAVTGGVVH
jgi:hypothetical protein